MKNYYKDKELLSAYIDGELSQEEKKYIEEKIKSSLQLQKDLSDLKKLKNLTSNSMARVSDSPFFETRLMATLNQNSSKKFRLKKWIPVIALSVFTIGLMFLLKFNPDFINNFFEKQKSNLAGFYKENLQPLLYAANLTNEDIFNFAMYQQLPLDSNKQQILKLGYDPKGAEYFEIKKFSDYNKIQSEDNFKKFVSALKLNQNEAEQIDSIIGSYSEQLSSMVLVNDKNSVAINPSLWNTRKAILADIISFAQKHASDNFNRIVPVEIAKIDPGSLTRIVNESRSIKDNQYIFFTPDSIFKDEFVFDMKEFRKNMKKMEVELKNLNKEQKKIQNFTFYVDTTFNHSKNKSKQSQQFRVFADSDFVKVTVQNLNLPDFDFENLSIPNFDSIAAIINEATKNLPNFKMPEPPMPFNNRGYNVDGKPEKQKKHIKVEINLDSLMNLKNIIADSIRSEQLNKLQHHNDSLNKDFNYLSTDSLIILQNNELKKEMDNLRRELKRFREEMKNYDKKDDGNNQKYYPEIKNDESPAMEI